jgi:alpha-amylase
MKTINFCFRVNQRINLKRYRFFEIGTDHYYYDDFANETSVRNMSDACYLEANRMFLDMINSSNGRFKVTFYITGLALEQFEQYAPEVLESFQALAKTGCVEFLAMPYAHSLASLYNKEEFALQVKLQAQKIYEFFGKKPTTFANSALIYSDEIGEMISDLGYKTIIVEGAKHMMGWKSPHYVYNHISDSKVRLLVRDWKLSDDICYRFSQWNWSEYPLTADKFIDWIVKSPEEDQVYNISMGYEALGVLNKKQSGIFEFFKALPFYAMERGVSFSTPSEIVKNFKSVGGLTALYPMSWTGEEKDISYWNGNELQSEAITKLYSLAERIHLCSDRLLKMDWLRLQDSANFFYMATKRYSSLQSIFYESSYEAFMNYMNVLSDFMERVNSQYPSSIENEELNALLKTIYNQEKEIICLQDKLKATKKAKAMK